MEEVRKEHLKTIWTAYSVIWFGVWLIAAPHVFGCYQDNLFWSDTVSGFLLIFLGFAAISYKRSWSYWLIALVGVWLQFAPLAFWAKSPACYLNDTLIGALLIVVSILIPKRIEESGPSIPPGWSYNPSSWQQRMPVVILGTVGWFISRYLSADQLGFIDRAWDPVFGAGTLHVITSKISKDFPVSDAGLGAMAYTLEVLLALKGGAARWRTMPWMAILFGLLVVPLGLVSTTLIILQPLVVGAWCTLCLCTAVCMMIMIAFAVDEIVAVHQYLRSVREEGKPFWSTFWKGGESKRASYDFKSPELDESFRKQLKAAVKGVGAPFNLVLSALIGVLLMLLPWILNLPQKQSDLDHVVGALTIVTSIISMAEVIRKVRFFNIALSLALFFSLFVAKEAIFLHAVLGISLVLLSFRRGEVRESYGNWTFF